MRDDKNETNSAHTEPKVKVLYRTGPPRYLSVTDLRARVYAEVSQGKYHKFNAHDAEDITQELLVMAITRGHFRWGWVSTVCDRERGKMRRQRARQVPLSDDLVDPADSLAQVLDNDLTDAIVRKLEGNSSIHARAAVVLLRQGNRAFLDWLWARNHEAHERRDRRFGQRPYVVKVRWRVGLLIRQTGLLLRSPGGDSFGAQYRQAARGTSRVVPIDTIQPKRRRNGKVDGTSRTNLVGQHQTA